MVTRQGLGAEGDRCEQLPGGRSARAGAWSPRPCVSDWCPTGCAVGSAASTSCSSWAGPPSGHWSAGSSPAGSAWQPVLGRRRRRRRPAPAGLAPAHPDQDRRPARIGRRRSRRAAPRAGAAVSSHVGGLHHPACRRRCEPPRCPRWLPRSSTDDRDRDRVDEESTVRCLVDEISRGTDEFRLLASSTGHE